MIYFRGYYKLMKGVTGALPEGGFSETEPDDRVSIDRPSTDLLRGRLFNNDLVRGNRFVGTCKDNFDSILSLPNEALGFNVRSGTFDLVRLSWGSARSSKSVSFLIYPDACFTGPKIRLYIVNTPF
jgi:hypothetical protein